LVSADSTGSTWLILLTTKEVTWNNNLNLHAVKKWRKGSGKIMSR
jgi:hypothetical protein